MRLIVLIASAMTVVGGVKPLYLAEGWRPKAPNVTPRVDVVKAKTPTTIHGVAEGNDPHAYAYAVAWSQGGISAVNIFTGGANWADFDGSMGWEIGLWENTAAIKLWSIPLIVTGASLGLGATGAYDAHYTAAAKQLVASQTTGPIYVRTGWEFNGAWEPWQAIGQPANYIATFQQFVGSFRSVSDRFVFVWTPNIGNVGMDPSTAYPGDKYVDIIGMDFYWHTQWDPRDPTQAWNSMVDRQYGLQWLETFAASHRKPTGYPEWGVSTDNAAPYIADAAAWFASHNVVFQIYWDNNSDYQGKLSGGALPAAATAYLKAFAPPTAGRP